MKTVIEMAREVWSAGDVYIGPSEKTLELFVELVRADAIAAEREACVKVSEEYDDEYDVHTKQTKEGITAAIRARSKT